jgi:hypothetical protein
MSDTTVCQMRGLLNVGSSKGVYIQDQCSLHPTDIAHLCQSICVFITQAAVAATASSDNTTTTSDSDSATVQVQKPRLLSVKGKVYDVSSSAAFGSGGPLQCLGMYACAHIHTYTYAHKIACMYGDSCMRMCCMCVRT